MCNFVFWPHAPCLTQVWLLWLRGRSAELHMTEWSVSVFRGIWAASGHCRGNGRRSWKLVWIVPSLNPACPPLSRMSSCWSTRTGGRASSTLSSRLSRKYFQSHPLVLWLRVGVDMQRGRKSAFNMVEWKRCPYLDKMISIGNKTNRTVPMCDDSLC